MALPDAMKGAAGRPPTIGQAEASLPEDGLAADSRRRPCGGLGVGVRVPRSAVLGRSIGDRLVRLLR